jgi:hypothetical protein
MGKNLTYFIRKISGIHKIRQATIDQIWDHLSMKKHNVGRERAED